MSMNDFLVMLAVPTTFILLFITILILIDKANRRRIDDRRTRRYQPAGVSQQPAGQPAQNQPAQAAAQPAATATRAERFYSTKWFKRSVSALIVVTLLFLLIPVVLGFIAGLAEFWRDITTIRDPYVTENMKRVVITREGEWSNPAPYVDDYKVLTWKVDEGKARMVLFRDADNPSIVYTNYFDGHVKYTNHIFRPQWQAFGIEARRPLVINYKAY